jgi:hypothetical protein
MEKRRVKREPFPWVLLLALLLTLALFWLLPRRLGSPPVKVEFAPAPASR